MYESAIEDNDSIHSEDSNNSNIAQKEKLESLINLELKHSSVYYDLHLKNNLLKIDLENLYNSCQRFESKIKKKSDPLEERDKKLMEYQQRNKSQLKEKLFSIVQKLEESNCLFCEAFEDYSTDVLKNSINYLVSETEKIDKNLKEITEQLNTLELKEKITESLMKPKAGQTSNVASVTKMLFASSMKRPEIEIEETSSKITNEIKKLEQKRQELKSVIRKPDK